MPNKNKVLMSFLLFLMINLSFGSTFVFKTLNLKKDTLISLKHKKTERFVNDAPVLIATGNQIYCPGTSMNIVTSMSITDTDDLGIDAIYIQISSGYENTQDVLTLTGFHPNINSSWNSLTGTLTLTGIASQPTYVQLEAAIEDVEFSNSATNPSGVRTFSISVGQANYLPSNQHYYQYIPNLGVTWSDAKALAQISTYYGLQGYLATITALDEAQLTGEQAAGAGWIGASDDENEGVWKWKTGPETGSNLVFTFWNTGEPNNLNNEDYAHVTAPGVGIPGSWNDLTNGGATSGDYQPKGFIVEYGGTPGDPVLQIATSSTITIPSIANTTAATNCGIGSVTLEANPTIGTVNWYATPTGGTSIATGTSFTTPILNTTTTYYADVFPTSCTTGTRTPVIATINLIPVVTITNPSSVCGNTTATILGTTTAGTINWFASLTDTTPIATGTSFTTPVLTQNTTYYAEGNNNGCLSGTRIPVTIMVFPVPIVVDETKIICENTTLTLDAGITNVTYLWSTNQTTQTIDITTGGTYTVTVTSLPPQNCSSTKTIVVTEHNVPQIQDVIVDENEVTLMITGFGDFEYSVDGENYQDSNVFTILQGGLYTAYVREKNDCGFDTKQFVVISIPKFFTPNGDGINETYSIKGLVYYPDATVKIFDRFGKLIKILNASDFSWDGTLNNEKLTSDDYWYIFKISDALPEVKGHFSLKR